MAPAAPPQSDDPPPAAGREQILAAFARNRTPPPVAPQPAQPPSPARPWFAPGPQPQEQEDLSEAAIDELLAGFAVGNMRWPRRLLGPAPGEDGCRISAAALRRNRLA